MWRILSLPFLFMLMATTNPSTIPDAEGFGRALASNNDWRAISIVLIVVIAMLMGFIAWRELGLSRLAKSLDAVTNALWAMRIALAERGIITKDEAPK